MVAEKSLNSAGPARNFLLFVTTADGAFHFSSLRIDLLVFAPPTMSRLGGLLRHRNLTLRTN